MLQWRVCARVSEQMREQLGSLLKIYLVPLLNIGVVTNQAIEHFAMNCCPFVACYTVLFLSADGIVRGPV